MKRLFCLLFAIVAFCASVRAQDPSQIPKLSDQAVDPEKLAPFLPPIAIPGKARQAPRTESQMGLASFIEVIWEDAVHDENKPVEFQISASIRDTGYFAGSYLYKFAPEPDSLSPSGGPIKSVTVKGKYPGRRQTGSNPTSCDLTFLVAKRFEVRVCGRNDAEVDKLVDAFDFQGLEKLASKN